MQTITILDMQAVRVLTESSYAVVQVRTQNSEYLVVKRPGRVTVLHTGNGKAFEARAVRVDQERLVVDLDTYGWTLTTTRIQSLHVLEN